MKEIFPKPLATMAVAFSVFGLAGAAEALTLVPPGLNPGDQYRLVFVTSTVRDATSSNIADYNTFVNNTANAIPEIAALGTTWTAIGSTATVNAIDNTATTGSGGVPIYNFGGLIVADDYPDLWDGSIDNQINVTEKDEIRVENVWTGSYASGRLITDDGLGNSLALGAGIVGYGTAGEVSEEWIVFTFGGLSAVDGKRSSLGLALYGMSGTLTVPGEPPANVPEPSSLLGFITLGTFMLGCAVRKARQ